MGDTSVEMETNNVENVDQPSEAQEVDASKVEDLNSDSKVNADSKVVTENGDKDKDIEETTTKEVPAPVRATRGAKRKADEAELPAEPETANNENAEQKENVKTTDEPQKENKIKEDPPVSGSNIMGKGKRARIPNKRYSDIILSANRKTPQKAVDTSLPENDSIESSPATISSPSVTKSRASTTKENLQDPKFLKPFKYGWRRELVWRGASKGNAQAKTIGDIYYFTPSGKKARSFRELAPLLNSNKNLSIDNFTYIKEPLGLDDPAKEIIRDAKIIRTSQSKRLEIRKPKYISQQEEEVVKSDGETPNRGGRRKLSSSATSSPEIEKNDVESPPTNAKKGKMQGKRKGAAANRRSKLAKQDESMDVDPVSPLKSTPSSKTSKTCQPCSIMCQGVQGIIPTLQCRVCLCLYHHECIGLSPNTTISYVCKNCDQEAGNSSTAPISSPPPPPLTPINSIKPSPSSLNNSLPKLQRIPRSDSDSIPHLPQSSNLSESRPSNEGSQEPSLNPETIKENSAETGGVGCKSLVGAVTSWLPHNVKLVNNSESTESPRPQYVEYLAGRKFLVIPKHNFMSVSSGGQEPSTGQIEAKNDETPGEGGDEIKELEQVAQSQSKLRTRNLKLRILTNNSFTADDKNEGKFAKNFLQNISFGYNTLLCVFQYLKVQDLIRAACVNTMWRDIASHPLLWRTVRMKNSQVHSFDGLAQALKKHGTVHLDLRKMLLPSSGDDIWPEFSNAISIVDTLRKIELCRCPASVVENLATSNPELEVINAVTIKCDSMSLDPFASLKSIKELRLKSTSGLNIKSIDSLKELKSLRVLSLTSVNDLHKLNLNVIADLVNLESLDLGECLNFPENFGEDVLSKLEKLEKLRLEKGQGPCHTFEMLTAVKSMPNLEQLELVNFDVKTGFDKAIGECTNIKKLMIIPTYISQSATTNNMVLSGVLRLQGTLTHFVWGVTLELLRVTELFVDQCEDANKKERKGSGNGDSIPVLKPVPDLSNGGAIQAATNPPQVEILPLPNLQKLLLNSLPTTRVKILKIPFHATWRQTLTDVSV